MSRHSRALVALFVLAVGAVLAGCQSGPGVAMWGPCGSVGGDITGTDGTYSMVCVDGVWTPIMTASEYVRIARKEPNVVIAPVPQRPVPTAPPVTTTVPAPTEATIDDVSPDSGPEAGGTTVTITGEGFDTVSAVGFGGVSAVSSTVNSDTQITAVLPAHSAGTVDVSVTTAGGTSSLPAAFAYVAPPTVSSVSPAVGPVTAGTTVTISGNHFADATEVWFSSLPAVSFTVLSDTQISAVAPASSAGVVNIGVANSAGMGVLSSAFTYLAAPTVTNVTDAAGPLSGWQRVYLTGTGFTGATAVNFGADAARSFEVYSDTSMSAVTPAASGVGSVDVGVTAPGGQGFALSAYTFVAAPVVSNVSPNTASISGGSTSTITGSGFTGATAVNFGIVSATSFTVVNDTTISVVVPARPAGVTSVHVTGPGGQAGWAGQFLYF